MQQSIFSNVIVILMATNIWMYLAGDKGFELKMLMEKHREEVTELKKRLQWYAENQELLDKDAARLRAATAETQRLTEQVENLKMEVGKRANEQQRKAKERAGEAKRIQDLERQVRHRLSTCFCCLILQVQLIQGTFFFVLCLLRGRIIQPCLRVTICLDSRFFNHFLFTTSSSC